MLAIRAGQGRVALPGDLPGTWYNRSSVNLGRARAARALDSEPGKHLVLVRYRPGHDAMREWVFNEPDIDSSRVVWARELDEHSDRHLIRYFAGRRVWLAEPDIQPPSLRPYPGYSASGVALASARE
jgi:hypothetical protein